MHGQQERSTSSCAPWSAASSGCHPLSVHVQTGGQEVLEGGSCLPSATRWDGGEQGLNIALSAQMSLVQLTESATDTLRKDRMAFTQDLPLKIPIT